MNHSYRHLQRSPLCLFLYAAIAMFWVTGLVLWDEPLVRWVFPPVGLLLLLLAASFHHLKIEDAGDRLAVSFGPVPCFRGSVRYDNIVSVKRGRTTILDG